VGWERYERAAERGPLSFFLAVFGLVIAIALVVTPVACLLGWFTEAAGVARTEFGPKAMLARYNWFKDAAAAIDSRDASIKVYERRFASLKEAYAGKARTEWSREDREQANLWEQEMAGIISARNALAGEYNSAMAKAQWKFTNVGDLPAGADVPLPREFKPYLVK
jgi:hypothetical protein